MHPSILDWAKQVLKPDLVKGQMVLEVGAQDVNGSVRPFVESMEPLAYMGVDSAAGDRVDQVIDCEKLCEQVGSGTWDLVISTEMLEHVRDWRTCCDQMVRAIKHNGFLLLTTRSPGYPYHPYPEDHWRFSRNDIIAICGRLSLWIMELKDDPEVPGVFLLALRKGLAMRPLTAIDVAPAPVT